MKVKGRRVYGEVLVDAIEDVSIYRGMVSHSSVLKSSKQLGTKETGYGLVALRLPSEHCPFCIFCKYAPLHFLAFILHAQDFLVTGHRHSSLLTIGCVYYEHAISAVL